MFRTYMLWTSCGAHRQSLLPLLAVTGAGRGAVSRPVHIAGRLIYFFVGFRFCC